MTTATQNFSDVPVPPRNVKRSSGNIIGWALVLALLSLSWEGADMRPMALINDAANMSQFASGFFPPDFTEWKMYVREIWITVQIAIWGTALAIVFSVPFGIMSSDNIVPWWICQPTRRLMDAARAINEMVFAMLFVVEAIDPRPVEGIRATGANALHEVIFGIIPQVLPLWISYSLYRFESNVRSATVLGIVGAGGVGMLLWEYIRGFYYAETAAVMFLVIISVSLLDMLSQRLRKLVI